MKKYDGLWILLVLLLVNVAGFAWAGDDQKDLPDLREVVAHSPSWNSIPPNTIPVLAAKATKRYQEAPTTTYYSVPTVGAGGCSGASATYTTYAAPYAAGGCSGAASYAAGGCSGATMGYSYAQPVYVRSGGLFGGLFGGVCAGGICR